MSAPTTAAAGQPPTQPAPRMLAWALITVALVAVALCMQSLAPGSMLAVLAYKASLIGLGGYGGYWLDRALFPYDRPHQYLQDAADVAAVSGSSDGVGPGTTALLESFPMPGGHSLPPLLPGQVSELQLSISSFGHSMLRRAVVVAACLVCVGLGAWPS